jgi:broad specificity phosphatase PhoE
MTVLSGFLGAGKTIPLASEANRPERTSPLMRLTLVALTALALSSLPADAQTAPPPVGHTTSQVHAAPALGSTAQLIEQMNAGGVVLVIRHERTEVPSREDDYTRPATDCTAQRNLSLAGLAGAQETGFALRSLSISVASVISSPMCRTTETARFMFGEYTTDPRLIHPNPGVEGGRDVEGAGQELATVLREQAGRGGNTAIVSHAGNIFRATGLRLAEGEIGIVRVRSDGSIEPLGQVVGSALGAQARIALSAGPG